MLGLAIALIVPMEETRLAVRLTLRALFAECSALRSFFASMSESECCCGGWFSSIVFCKRRLGLAEEARRKVGSCEGDKLPVLTTSSARNGEDLGEVDNLRLNDGGSSVGEPSEVDCLLLDRNPAWKRLGFAAGIVVVSGISILELDSS